MAIFYGKTGNSGVLRSDGRERDGYTVACLWYACGMPSHPLITQ